MRLRTMRSWIVLAALAAIVIDAVHPSAVDAVLAGASCILGAVCLVLLDGLRKRPRR